MTRHNQKIGAWGELMAEEHLRKLGHVIVARNLRTPYGEIDVITRDGDLTVFTEVKTLTSKGGFLPEEQVTTRKREHMVNCAEYYASEHGIDNWRIDVIAVEGKPGNPPTITHFENAIS